MIDHVAHPGAEKYSPARRIGAVLASYMLRHPEFYFFSPDETTSNKLDAVFEVADRAWALPRESWDLPESPDGHIVEMLSENTLFACMIGHLMNDEPAAMTSYESFFTIIASQVQQHLKFLSQSREVAWRPSIPAANLLSTSTCWRQDHNGFTHQSPMLISMLLANPSGCANCLFPLDDVAAESAMIYMLGSKDVVNLCTFNKTDQPRYLNSHQADAEFHAGGASQFEFGLADDSGSNSDAKSAASPAPARAADHAAPARAASPDSARAADDSSTAPDYILVGVGDIVSVEAIKALELLRADLPEFHYRFVNISALTYNAIGTADRKLTAKEFQQLFPPKAQIIANFHGYPDALRQIFSCYTDLARVQVHGFLERGSTTTPFEMLSMNEASRYHLALDVARHAKRPELVAKYQKILADNTAYAKLNGVDQIE